MNRLTVEEIEWCTKNYAAESCHSYQLANQLLDAMRENVRLRKALEVMATWDDSGRLCEEYGCNAAHFASQALSNKESDHDN